MRSAQRFRGDRRQRPELQTAIRAGTVQGVIVRMEGDATNRAGVRSRDGNGLTVGRVPESQRLITAARDEKLTIVAERYTGDRPRMSVQLEQFLTIGTVPYLHMSIFITAGNLRPIGSNGQRADTFALGDVAQRTGARKVPEHGFIIGTARSDQAAVGANGHTEDEVLMAGRTAVALEILAGDAVPHLNGTIAAAADDVLAVRRIGHGVDSLTVPFQGGDQPRCRSIVGGRQPGQQSRDDQQYRKCGEASGKRGSWQTHGLPPSL